MTFVYFVTATEDAAIAKHLPNHYHRPATIPATPISTCHLTASPARRKPRTCRQSATTTTDDSATVSATDWEITTTTTTAARHLRVRSPVKSIDRRQICGPEGPEPPLELNRLTIAFPLWWDRAVMYPICATLKTLNLKPRMSDRECRRRWQPSINRVNPSRRTSKIFWIGDSNWENGTRVDVKSRAMDVIYGLAVPLVSLPCSFPLFCRRTDPAPYFADPIC